jgi:hypothetical protein
MYTTAACLAWPPVGSRLGSLCGECKPDMFWRTDILCCQHLVFELAPFGADGRVPPRRVLLLSGGMLLPCKNHSKSARRQCNEVTPDTPACPGSRASTGR